MKNYPACKKLNEMLPMLYAVISTTALPYKENKKKMTYLWLEKITKPCKQQYNSACIFLNNRGFSFLIKKVFHVVFHWRHLDEIFPMRRHNKYLQWKIRKFRYLIDKNLILDPRPWKQQHCSATFLLET